MRSFPPSKNRLAALEQDKAAGGAELRKMRTKSGGIVTVSLALSPVDGGSRVTLRFNQYNHPSEHSRLDFTQSWKRTGGWALERILQRHYGPALAAHNINLVIADVRRKAQLLSNINVGHRLEAAKIDVLLTVGSGAAEQLIGVVHVKASFAERRTDDVPMSQALVNAGYISPLWTMDCKSTPSVKPKNIGELGRVFSGHGKDARSAKRKDIEDDRFFSACFSYNKNTEPTPASYRARASIVVCDFSNPNNAFTRFIVAERQRVRTALGI